MSIIFKRSPKMLYRFRIPRKNICHGLSKTHSHVERLDGQTTRAKNAHNNTSYWVRNVPGRTDTPHRDSIRKGLANDGWIINFIRPIGEIVFENIFPFLFHSQKSKNLIYITCFSHIRTVWTKYFFFLYTHICQTVTTYFMFLFLMPVTIENLFEK